jgi:ubiquinone/menaquinone biosynthesis C-methylase UbiE
LGIADILQRRTGIVQRTIVTAPTGATPAADCALLAWRRVRFTTTMREAMPTPPRSRMSVACARLRPVLAALVAFGLLASGAPVETQGLPPKHPITGRQIAHVYTGATWLDRIERDAEEQPDRAVELLGITPGMVVADVGAGTGYMTIRLARRVGPQGIVYANDLQANMLRVLQEKMRAERITNVQVVQGTETDTRLPASAIDLAVLVDVYHEFWHPQEMLLSIRRALKPGGQLVLFEYRKEDPALPILPDHKMTVNEVRTEVEPEGFVFDRLISQLPRQHIIVFRKPR